MQGGEIRHGLADVGLEHLGDQIADAGVQQPTGEIGDHLEVEPGLSSFTHRRSAMQIAGLPRPTNSIALGSS